MALIAAAPWERSLRPVTIEAPFLRPARPRRLETRGNGCSSFIRVAAAVCGFVSARSFATIEKEPDTLASERLRRTAQRADGRVLEISAEKSKSVPVENATVAGMNDLMKREAVNILAAGAEKTEEVKGQKGMWHAYMKPTTMGTWKNQARLTCKLMLKPGAVNVEVVSLEVGNWDKDLRQFKFEKFDEDTFSLNWQNSMTWRERGSDLAVQHLSRGSMRLVIPWWFPLPDTVVKATFQAGIRYMISDGQSKIAAAVTQRYADLER